MAADSFPARVLFEALVANVPQQWPGCSVDRTDCDFTCTDDGIRFKVHIENEAEITIVCFRREYTTVVNSVAVGDGKFAGRYRFAYFWDPSNAVEDAFEIPIAFPWHLHSIPRNRYDALFRVIF